MAPKLADILTRMPARPSAVSNSGSSAYVSSDSLGANSLLAAAATQQTPISIREKILSRRDTSLFMDHKHRAMEIAFADNSGVAVELMEFSLFCPYAQTRMSVPVRSRQCQHIQCCDIESWVSLFSKFRAMRDPIAPCPVCDVRVALSTLEVDEWIVSVLRNLPSAKFVVLQHDGAYRSSAGKRKREEEEVLDTQPEHAAHRISHVFHDEDETNDEDAGDEPGTSVTTYAAPSAGMARPMKEGLLLAATKAELFVEALTSHCRNLGGTSAADDLKKETHDVPPLVVVKKEEAGLSSAWRDVSLHGAVMNHTLLGAHSVTAASFAFSSQASKKRVMSTGWRQWVCYCPVCGVADAPPGCPFSTTVVAVSPCDGVQYDGEDAPLKCRVCHRQRTRQEWPACRKFPFTASGRAHCGDVSIECTEDGTTLLRGASELSLYLSRAGFSCTSNWWLDSCQLYASVDVTGPPPSADEARSTVWFTSRALTRMELDFLESMCSSIAAGDPVAAYSGVVPTLFKFRWEKSGRPAFLDSAHSQFGQLSQVSAAPASPSPQAPDLACGSVSALPHTSAATAVSSAAQPHEELDMFPTSPTVATRSSSGSFRIQIAR